MISFRTPNQPLPMETNPRVVFERMIGTDATGMVELSSGGTEGMSIGLAPNAKILDNVIANRSGTGIDMMVVMEALGRVIADLDDDRASGICH